MHGGRIAGRTGRAVARPVRVARSHVPRVLLAAVALIVVLSQVNIAYALPWAEKDGYPLGEILMSQDVGANRGTVVYGAANEFFATLCLIGRKSDYLQLSSEQLSELSGEGTGGAFWELSQRWNNYESDGMPDTWPIGISAAMQAEGLISDPAYIWYADYSYYESDSLYNRALADYLTIYNGGHLGGSTSDPFVLTCNVKPNVYDISSSDNPDTYYAGNISGIFYREMNLRKDGVVYPVVMPDIRLQINSPTISGYLEQGMKLYAVGTLRFGSGNRVDSIYFDCYVTDVEPVVTDVSYVSQGYTIHCESYSFTKGDGHLYNFSDRIYSGPDGVFTMDNPGLSVRNSVTLYNSPSSSNPYKNSYVNFGASGGGGGGGGGTWPEPDPPTPPNPPEVPGPGTNDDPGIELPDPYMPIVDPVTDPDPITDPYVVVVAPDSSDIIEWLRSILRAINNLGDKLNAESTELQNALNKVFFTNLSRLLKNLKGEFIQDYTSWLNKELQWLNSEIHDYFVDMQNYLYRLFDWLADQMNFELNLNTDPYDDTSLLNWLRRIYNKLGADGGPNTRPVDPSTDEDGFLDWLRRMIQNFILDLGAAASDVVSDLGDLLSRLFAKFPFSVPWDLLAILGILDAPTMVPRLTFDIPLTMGTSTFTWHVDIDLQAWSAYMEAVRTIILVSFISWLIWLTPQVLRDLDPGDFL